MIMTCLEARKCIYAYLNNKLNDRELHDFLQHIEECPECKEELRITHMVYSGVAKLDSDTESSMNFDESFRKSLEQSKMHLFLMTVLRNIRYAIDTCAFWGIMIALALQIRIWLIG